MVRKGNEARNGAYCQLSRHERCPGGNALVKRSSSRSQGMPGIHYNFKLLSYCSAAAMATGPLKDRIRAEYAALLDNFTNLLRSARLPDEAGEVGGRPQVSSLGLLRLLPACPPWKPYTELGSQCKEMRRWTKRLPVHMCRGSGCGSGRYCPPPPCRHLSHRWVMPTIADAAYTFSARDHSWLPRVYAYGYRKPHIRLQARVLRAS